MKRFQSGSAALNTSLRVYSARKACAMRNFEIAYLMPCRKSAYILDKKLKTKGPESIYFCQPGIHRSPHRASVDTIYFDNFILADTLEEVMNLPPGK